MHREINIGNSKNGIRVAYEPYSKKYLFFNNGKIPYLGITAISISSLILLILGVYIPSSKLWYTPYPYYEPGFLFLNFNYSYHNHFSIIGLFSLLNFAAIIQSLIWHYAFKLSRNKYQIDKSKINEVEELDSANYDSIVNYRLKTINDLQKFIRLDVILLIIIYLVGLLMFYFTYTDNGIYTWDMLFFEPYFTIFLFAITFSL
ncbi:hypothetical protein [Companilactobacillus jidongensis]|uniref:hypothetical protein n=1 Tax=Companilactobacillus jidongensis TaxID=2486006 RepID=UPI000F785250|nr:hypothetical protein [Companilactobacillus jidongensis]